MNFIIILKIKRKEFCNMKISKEKKALQIFILITSAILIIHACILFDPIIKTLLALLDYDWSDNDSNFMLLFYSPTLTAIPLFFYFAFLLQKNFKFANKFQIWILIAFGLITIYGFINLLFCDFQVYFSQAFIIILFFITQLLITLYLLNKFNYLKLNISNKLFAFSCISIAVLYYIFRFGLFLTLALFYLSLLPYFYKYENPEIPTEEKNN